ncbi:MAG: tyrosine-type recombinase/integrase [Verrucomicrobia bacterium]|nr:tyrosine-type recombinase/integrase [Verrucomicrobiota bacterium]
MSRHTRKQKPETVTVGNVRVKIYARQRPTLNGGNRTVFEVSDYTSGIRRLRGFTEHTDARKEAERIARQLSSGNATAANMLSSETASYGRAIELLRPTGVSLELAAGTFAKCFETLGGDRLLEAARFYRRHNADKLPQKIVREVVEELLTVKSSRRASGRYVEDLKSRLSRFADSFAVQIENITTGDVQGWLDRLKLAPRTLLNFRRAVSTLFEFSRARGYVFENPVIATERPNTRNGEAVTIYAPAELAKLLGVASADFLPVIVLCAFCGLRSAEAERLDWRDVDLKSGFVTISAQKAKTRSRRLVPIPANAKTWLATYSQKSGPIWPKSHCLFYERQRETARAAGVEWKANALRHSFISYRLAETQDVAQVALEAGNSPQIIFANYRELVRPDTAKAWFAIGPDAPANVLAMTGGAK